MKLRIKRPSREAMLAIAAMAAIVVAAVLLRFYDLSTNPGGMYPDEAAEGLDALKMMHQPGFHPDWLVWFQDDAGREALFAYIVSGAFHIFGSSALILRGTAAAIGVAGVLAIGHVGRRFGTWVGVTAAAWSAGSLWLICISRDGMRNTIVPLFGALALIALIRWADKPGRISGALAGGVTALAALYTYQPLKLLPLLAALWLAWLFFIDRDRFKTLRSGLIPFVAAFLLVGFPMLMVAITEPASYFGRAVGVSTFNPEVVSDSSFPIHVLRTIGMFGFTGDGNVRHDVSALPLLPLPLVPVFVAGVWRLWRNRREPGHSLILISLPVFMIPAIVATEGYSPHFLRVLGMAAPIGVTMGLGAAGIVEWARSRWNRAAGGIAIAVVAVLLAATAAWSGWVYLNRPVSVLYPEYSYDTVAAGDYAAAHPGSAVIVSWLGATDIQFLHWDDQPVILSTGTKITDPKNYTVIVALSRNDLRDALGPTVAARAFPVAWDPSGKPVVWAVIP